MSLAKIIAAALSTSVIVGGAASVQAHTQNNNNGEYRVVNLAGGETLAMRSRPSRNRGYVVTRIPFNARYIVKTNRDRRGHWVHFRHNGQSGWVHQGKLARDFGGPTYYKASLGRYGKLEIHRRPNKHSRVRGVIPNGATDVVSAGNCQGAWCRIRYHGIRGWVQKHCLIVTRRTPRNWRRDRFNDFRSSSYRQDLQDNPRRGFWRSAIRRQRMRNVDYRN